MTDARVSALEAKIEALEAELAQVGWQLDAARRLLAIPGQVSRPGHCPKCETGVKRCICECHSPSFRIVRK